MITLRFLISQICMSSLEIRVGGRYRLEEKLYEGKYSTIYAGCNVQSDSYCSIKCEPKNIKPSLVINEGKVLQEIQGGIGVPNLLWQGQNGDFNFLVTQLLGNSLEDYLQLCKGVFSVKTVLMIADKVLSTLQYIHDKYLIHRDIQPGNFLMGLGKKIPQLYIIDYAFATPYYDQRISKHRPDYLSLNQNNFVGTLKFSSLAVLRGRRPSRRDDLQSFGLMMVYFLKGNLPWNIQQNISTSKEKRKCILAKMESITLQQLCSGLPKEFLTFMEYCRRLEYDQNPDYNYLRRLFYEKLIREGYQYDSLFDWILLPLRLKDTQLSNHMPLNRTSKKESNDLAMANSDYNFKNDFDYMNEWIALRRTPREQKAICIQESSKIQTRTGRLGFSSKSPLTKNGKDCQIY